MISRSHGDGFTPTSALAPCACPSCRAELEIVCPNGCASAEDGLSGYVDPIALLRPAKVYRPGTAKGPAGQGTSGRIMRILRSATKPVTTIDLAPQLADVKPAAIAMMLSWLTRRGYLARVGRGRYVVASGAPN